MLSGTITPYSGSKLFVPDGHFCGAMLLEGLVPEYHMNEVFKKLIRLGDTVIDVGANIGFHTLSMKSLVGPSGKVYAVEADMDNVFCLKRSIEESGDKNIYLLPVAASDRSGIIPMMSSYNTNTVFSSIAGKTDNVFAVGVVLDEIIVDKVDFIKLDIEGAEILALKGMTKIVDDRPIITSEFSPHNITTAHGTDRSLEFLSYFTARDYDCYYITPAGNFEFLKSPTAVIEKQQWAREELNSILVDLLFLPSEKSLDAALQR